MLISAIAGGDRGIRTPDLCHDMTVVLHPSSPFSLNLYSLYYTFFTGLTEPVVVSIVAKPLAPCPELI
jgi:hypothetical protein